MLNEYKKRIETQSLKGELDIEAELYHARRLKAATVCPELRETYEQFIQFLANFTVGHVVIANHKIYLN